ncbi:hypothetical protein SAURM35S_03995 [Streptomyces aurantiogriseus]
MPLPPAARSVLDLGGGFARFSMSTVVDLPTGIDRAGLEATLAAVLDHHDILRTRLVLDDDGGHLEVTEPGSVDIAPLIREVVWAQDRQAQAAAELDAATGRLDPTAGVMAQFVWFTPDDGTGGRTLLVLHHLVVDAVSWRILLPDLAAAWRQIRDGQAPALPPVGTSARRWAHALEPRRRRTRHALANSTPGLGTVRGPRPRARHAAPRPRRGRHGDRKPDVRRTRHPRRPVGARAGRARRGGGLRRGRGAAPFPGTRRRPARGTQGRRRLSARRPRLPRGPHRVHARRRPARGASHRHRDGCRAAGHGLPARRAGRPGDGGGRRRGPGRPAHAVRARPHRPARLPHVHLRLDRAAEGRRGHPSRRRLPRPGPAVRQRRPRAGAAALPAGLRRRHVRAVGAAAERRPRRPRPARTPGRRRPVRARRRTPHHRPVADRRTVQGDRRRTPRVFRGRARGVDRRRRRVARRRPPRAGHLPRPHPGRRLRPH